MFLGADPPFPEYSLEAIFCNGGVNRLAHWAEAPSKSARATAQPRTLLPEFLGVPPDGDVDGPTPRPPNSERFADDDRGDARSSR